MGTSLVDGPGDPSCDDNPRLQHRQQPHAFISQYTEHWCCRRRGTAASKGGARRKYSKGKRRSRDAPLGRGRDRTRTDASDGESKRTQRRTLPLMLRQGEPTVAAQGGDGRGWLLSTTVVLRVDVADSRYFNPKEQAGASFLVKVGFN